ncbi:MAG: hypothetical protein CMN77_07115 [Spirochaetaceae bacterium]|nr:hypothetical protein [Spirochaetaceae bacterium]
MARIPIPMLLKPASIVIIFQFLKERYVLYIKKGGHYSTVWFLRSHRYFSVAYLGQSARTLTKKGEDIIV